MFIQIKKEHENIILYLWPRETESKEKFLRQDQKVITMKEKGAPSDYIKICNFLMIRET